MEIPNWQEFYHSLVIEASPTNLAKPTTEQLDYFEADTGCRLPKSYRDYIAVFGPGEIPCVLNITAPGYENTNHRIDLLSANQSYGYTESQILESRLPSDQKERLQRLFYFGLLRGQDWLAWDFADVRDSQAPEYGIYGIDFRLDKIELLATSFRQLIESICDEIFADDPDYDELSMGPQRSYVPATWESD